ncbi:hypothetical protein [Acinetobacter bereziniae]|uniref:hypothetical protein n=1 Tax=Acinetobacter bereziniae TaxID=106648 RepID=UPI001900AF6E|nr:hypothetical protein [Acinetobacter bereziniae]MBJ9904521.1 hypothetical protein [Acinetobacter bereziniae]MCU4600301.1 hypothetical protein [Acinetobacter bereziniae]
MSQISREQLIDLYKKANFQEDYTKGQITVDSPLLVQNLTLAFNSDITGWSQIGIDPITINQSYKFYHRIPRASDFGHIFNNMDQLCSNSFFKSKNNKKYFVINLKFDSGDSNKPQIIKNYETLLHFLRFLEKAAAFVDSTSSKMLFLEPEKMDLEIFYSSSDLINLDLESIGKIESYIFENTHESQKLAILSKAIVTQCKSEDFSKRFGKLLKSLKDIYETLDHDYAVFASSFSYDKLRSEIENSKLEEQVKIHKIITDIQNQILGIPVATVIVATQFKTQKQVDYNAIYQFSLNTGIFIGVFIFVLILWFLIKNQKESLLGLEKEILRKDLKFKLDSPVVYKKIESSRKPPFKELFDRIDTQKKILNIISWIGIIGLIVTFLIYYSITVNPKNLF